MIFFNPNVVLDYSFSTTRAMSGMENNSTAFVGCDDGHVSILTTKLGIACTVLLESSSQFEKILH